MAESHPAVVFATEGESAAISYSVPMPSSHTGRRLIKLTDTVSDTDWRPEARTLGQDLLKELGLDDKGEGAPNSAQFAHSYQRLFVRPLAAHSAVKSFSSAGKSSGANSSGPLDEYVKAATQLLADSSLIVVPALSWAGRLTELEIDPTTQGGPILLLVEVYGISSFLGDYGLGRTVRTFSLFPGEETKVSLKTWRSTKESISEGSSIIDSHQETAATRFAEKLTSESTDKATQNSKESWHAEAKASASWGWGSASVSGGGSGEYQSGREQFARTVSDVTAEHAAEASAKREASVTSSTERSVETGEESLIERTIRNVNMRRTLNLVFRELNQEYITKIHLKDIRLAFTNGRVNSYREVPLSGIRTLLAEVVRSELVDSIAVKILDTVAVAFDKDDNPVPLLEMMELSEEGDNVSHQTATKVEGAFPPPRKNRYYRFKRGPLGNQGKNPVHGVVLQERKVVMRTDSIFIEALLGQADALDDYAMEIQAAAATAKTLTNKREELLQAALAAITDPVERAKVGAIIQANQPTATSTAKTP